MVISSLFCRNIDVAYVATILKQHMVTFHMYKSLLPVWQWFEATHTVTLPYVQNTVTCVAMVLKQHTVTLPYVQHCYLCGNGLEATHTVTLPYVQHCYLCGSGLEATHTVTVSYVQNTVTCVAMVLKQHAQ